MTFLQRFNMVPAGVSVTQHCQHKYRKNTLILMLAYSVFFCFLLYLIITDGFRNLYNQEWMWMSKWKWWPPSTCSACQGTRLLGKRLWWAGTQKQILLCAGKKKSSHSCKIFEADFQDLQGPHKNHPRFPLTTKTFSQSKLFKYCLCSYACLIGCDLLWRAIYLEINAYLFQKI